MLERLPLPRIATFALCAVIGLQLAWIVTGLYGSRDTPSAGTPAAELARSASAAADAGQGVVARIAAAQLFGDPGAGASDAGSAAAPPTSLGLVLVGVFAREDPEGGRAIIGESAAAARLYAVGAALPGGARLLEVHGDRVILGVGGARETLLMPRATVPVTAPATPPEGGVAPLAAAPTAAVGAAAAPDEFVRWQAILKDGRIAGVRVYPGERAELFKRSGLQPGDLVVEINGTPLASAAGAAQFAQTLSATPLSTLRVERGGRYEQVQVDMARLMAPGAE